jgi:hypothetical protein
MKKSPIFRLGLFDVGLFSVGMVTGFRYMPRLDCPWGNTFSAPR